MVEVHLLGFAQVAVAVGGVAEAGVAESEHVEAVDAVHVIETAVPHLQVGETDGKVVHDNVIIEMLFAIIDEPVEI